MTDVNVDFVLENDEPIRADFDVEQGNTLVADLIVQGSNDHNVLINRGMANQHPISAITDLQETLDTLHGEIGSIGQTIGTYGDIVTHNTDEFATAEQGALADTALQPGDNISELVNDSHYATETYVDNGLSTKQDTISDLSAIRSGAELGATSVQRVETGNSNGTIRVDGRDVAVKGLGSAAYTESTDYDVAGSASTAEANAKDYADSLSSNYATSAQGALADTALQPNDNISELNNDVGYITGIDSTDVTNALGYTPYDASNPAGYITSASIPTNYVTTDTAQTIGASKAFSQPLVVADNIGLASGTILTNDKILQRTSSGITLGNANNDVLLVGKSTTARPKYNSNDLALYSDVTAIDDLIPSSASSSNQLADKNYVDDSVSTNTAYFDGSWATYADIPSTVAGFTNESLPEPTNNNYLVVLEDETQDGGTWRYKYVDDGGAYNKSKWAVEYQINETPFTQAQLDAINSGVTSSDVALAQSALQSGDNVSELVNDVGYITSSALPTVNDATLTIQKNGTTVNTFTANASSNVTANITVPTDTNDLTNGAGYITGINSSDVTTALGYTPADDSGVVKLTGNQTISGTKSFNSSLTRTSTIDPSTTTGETEVRTLSTVTNNGTTVIASYNATRSATTFSNRQRVNNPNLSNAWYDIRVNVNDAGQGYINCAGSSTVTNLSHTYATSSTGAQYIPTMGWVNNASTATNVVHRNSTETISGNKTFSGSNTFSGANSFTGDNTFTKQIYGTLASYSATNGSSNANPYKKIGECVITGAYQTVIVPFVLTRTATSNDCPVFGRITMRTEATAGEANSTSSKFTFGEVSDYLNGFSDYQFYVCYQNHYPESNQVTFQIWVYVKNTYNGVNIMPLRQGTGGANYTTSLVTWGNNLVEDSALPAGYTANAQDWLTMYAYTPATADWSAKIATTGFVKNQGYVTKANAQDITGTKTFTVEQKFNNASNTTTHGGSVIAYSAGDMNIGLKDSSDNWLSRIYFGTTGAMTLYGTVTTTTQTAGDNSTKVATTAYVDTAVSAATGTHIIETWHSGTEWYRVWSDGWCEQGGHMDKESTISHGASWEVTVNLHKTFDDTNYSAFLTYTYGTSTNNTAGMEYHTNSKNTNYFKANVYNRNSSTAINSTIGFDWEAKGYITIT